MSREKQIEEIKDHIDSIYGCDCAYYGVDGLGIAAELYNAGYRKQSEGKWVLIWNGNGRAIHWKCSVCGYETLDSINGDTNFCPNCGADMGGGE